MQPNLDQTTSFGMLGSCFFLGGGSAKFKGGKGKKKINKAGYTAAASRTVERQQLCKKMLAIKIVTDQRPTRQSVESRVSD